MILKFLRKPDPFYSEDASWENLINVMMEDLLTIDRGAAIKVRDEFGNLIAVVAVDGSTLRPVLNQEGYITHYVQVIDQQPTRNHIDKKDVMFLRQNTSSDIYMYGYGIPPMEVLYTTVLSDLFIDKGNVDYYRKGGSVPEGFLVIEPPTVGDDAMYNGLDQEELDAVQRRLQSIIMSDFTQIPVVSGGKFSWIDLKGNRRDMQFKELAEYLTRKICAVYQVSPQDVGVLSDINRACYSEDTETLTDNGWKMYYDITEDDKIATLNPENNMLEFHKPNESIYLYDYSGPMYHFKSSNVDVMVTPEHKMWINTDRNKIDATDKNTWKKVEAKNVPSQFRFLGQSDWNGLESEYVTIPAVEKLSHKIPVKVPEKTYKTDLWLEFLGYMLSEGCVFEGKTGQYLLNISQKKEKNINKIQTILDQLEIIHTLTISKDGTHRWQFANKQLHTYLKAEIGTKSFTKRIPKWIKNLSKRQLSILFDALMLGDGTYSKRHKNSTSMAYYTNSKILADDVQEIAIKLGYRAIVTNGSRCFRVLMQQGTNYQLRKDKNLNLIDYTGKVYCFNVPNHLFFVRRNGRVSIQGNTAETQAAMTKSKGLDTLASLISKTFTTNIIDELRDEQDLKLWFDEDDIENKQARWNVTQGQLQTGYKTINEARSEDGLEPMVWGDTPMQGLKNWVPLDQQQGAGQGGQPPMPPGMGGQPNTPPVPSLPDFQGGNAGAVQGQVPDMAPVIGQPPKMKSVLGQLVENVMTDDFYNKMDVSGLIKSTLYHDTPLITLRDTLVKVESSSTETSIDPLELTTFKLENQIKDSYISFKSPNKIVVNLKISKEAFNKDNLLTFVSYLYKMDSSTGSSLKFMGEYNKTAGLTLYSPVPMTPFGSEGSTLNSLTKLLYALKTRVTHGDTVEFVFTTDDLDIPENYVKVTETTTLESLVKAQVSQEDLSALLIFARQSLNEELSDKFLDKFAELVEKDGLSNDLWFSELFVLCKTSALETKLLNIIKSNKEAHKFYSNLVKTFNKNLIPLDFIALDVIEFTKSESTVLNSLFDNITSEKEKLEFISRYINLYSYKVHTYRDVRLQKYCVLSAYVKNLQKIDLINLMSYLDDQKDGFYKLRDKVITEKDKLKVVIHKSDDTLGETNVNDFSALQKLPYEVLMTSINEYMAEIMTFIYAKFDGPENQSTSDYYSDLFDSFSNSFINNFTDYPNDITYFKDLHRTQVDTLEKYLNEIFLNVNLMLLDAEAVQENLEKLLLEEIDSQYFPPVELIVEDFKNRLETPDSVIDVDYVVQINADFITDTLKTDGIELEKDVIKNILLNIVYGNKLNNIEKSILQLLKA